MNMKKIFWGGRALIYKPFFKKMGYKTYIGKCCYLSGTKNVSVGDKVRIFPGLRMEVLDKGTIEIQDNVVINQNVHITCQRESLIIQSGTSIGANVYITNIDHEYRDIRCNVLMQPNNVKTTIIGADCTIGNGSGIQAGTKLGKHCIVGSNSVVRGEFPDYCVIVGAPAKIVKRYNVKLKEWENV